MKPALAFPAQRTSLLSSLCAVVCSVLLVVLGCCAATPAPQSHDFKPVRELPADIPTCRQVDTQLNECIRAAFEQMMPRLREGIPELNIPPTDPYVVAQSEYEYNTGMLQGRISMRDVRVYGMSGAHVRSVDFEMLPAGEASSGDGDDEARATTPRPDVEGRMRMEMVLELPQLLVEGAYKADMKFNDINMTPKGYFNLSMTDIVITARPEGELYRRGDDGHTYLRLTRFPSEPEVGAMRVYASGLVPDPALNAILLDFINQYWRPLYRAMLPQTRAVWEPLMVSTANEFFAALPFDLLLTKE